MSEMKLQNRVALVTGAASGIGRGVVERFAAEGAKVVVADINLPAAEETAAAIRKRGGEAQAVELDVTSEAQVNQTVANVIDESGGVDILVSNAGVQHIAAVDELEFADWRRLLAVHLDGAFLTSKACLKHMYAAGGGSIILMGSVHSKHASKLKAPYVTAKHGLLGLCKVIAKEGAPHNVRCNVICPGFVRTPLVDKQIPEQAVTLGISEDEVVKEVMLGETVDGEFTTIEDVAGVALLFASFETNALTGQSLVASHGWFME